MTSSLFNAGDAASGFLGYITAPFAIAAFPIGIAALTAGALMIRKGRIQGQTVTFTPTPIPEGLGLAMNTRF